MTSANRFDLFTPVHKGLRAVLFETAARLARTDFSVAAEAMQAARAVERVVAFLDEHAGHEDAVILPVVEAHVPELFIALREEHARLDGLQRDVTRLAARLGDASEAERIAIGRRLHDRFELVVAEHLHHMHREEHDVQRTLRAHRGDDELRALHARILGRIPPPRGAEWMELMLPALSGPERSALAADVAARS
jgi:hemerythrin HHE cation binding domain-containing protein